MVRAAWLALLTWAPLGISALARCHPKAGIDYCSNTTPTPTPTNKPDCHVVNGQLLCFEAAGATATIQVPLIAEATATTLSILTIPDADGLVVTRPPKPKATAQPNKSTHGHGLKDATRPEKRPTACKSKKGETWNLKLRIASIFVIFLTSTLGVLGPLVLSRYTKLSNTGYVFLIIKQFGTGIILSTVFIHLLDHAVVQFDNPCIGELDYEPTPMAVMLAGAFLSFLVDYAGIKYLNRRYPVHQISLQDNSTPVSPVEDNLLPGEEKNYIDRFEVAHLERTRINYIQEKKLGVLIMEGGIIFHSIMVGVLLTITPDSELVQIFAVVLVHQLSEGLALGARIEPLAALRDSSKLVLGLAFSITCPIGMSIGIGVRKSFNVNDRRTVVLLGVMNALSAGVLAWVGFVELWSKDWVHGELRTAGWRRSAVGMLALISGLVLMGVLGQWA